MKIIKNLALAALAVLAVALMSQTSITRAEDHGQKGEDNERGNHDQRVNNPFVLLLKGIVVPVVHFPDLGLSQMDLSDGTYSTVPTYSVSGIPGTKKDKAIGTFYVQPPGVALCAYYVPGGSFSAGSGQGIPIPK
jgi:hypothetical protein